MLIAIQLIAGILLLCFGAEYLVRGSVRVALTLGVSPLMIGLTLVAAATSAPELVVSLTAALKGLDDISAGNVVGSNICNVALILGLTALISPMPVKRALLRFDIPVLLIATLIFWGIGAGCGTIGRWGGALLLGGMIAYIVRSVLLARRGADVDVEEVESQPVRGVLGWLLCIAMIAGGTAGLIFGGNLLIEGAVSVGKLLGISDAVIALTVVAVGTSLPELATSVMAAIRKQQDIAIGNVIGSNLFNILSIMGITPLVKPVYSGGISGMDWGILLLTTGLLVPIALSKKGCSRLWGAVLLGIYCIYTVMLACGQR
ncbi:MAG: calcium/sodium antiporter [Lentisphaeria bacterium]|nr:calcium/sodium antiporter [Lentisphaeria bacterium]